MVESRLLSQFEEVSRTLLNSYIEEWKEQGKKVLGYNCTYFPEEIVHAAGLLPFRIRGTGCTETTLADSFLARANCSFARACLEQGCDFILPGRAAILHHDLPRRIRDDADFEATALPVSADYLRTEGLGEAFVKYMSGWRGFVQPAQPDDTATP